MLLAMAFSENNDGGIIEKNQIKPSRIYKSLKSAKDKAEKKGNDIVVSFINLLTKIVEGFNLKKVSEGNIMIILILIIMLGFIVHCLSLNTPTSNRVAIILIFMIPVLVAPFVYIFISNSIYKRKKK